MWILKVADNNPSTLQSILENLRDFAVAFAKPYQTPANIPGALKRLLADLGINDPEQNVTNGLTATATAWGHIADTLSQVNFEFTDPVKMAAQISSKAGIIKQNIEAITNVPEAVWNGLGESGQAIKSVFPKRLLDFIIYESLTKSHPKIGGAFLLFGVLRKDFIQAANPAFTGTSIRIFDLAQMIHVITHPREAILEALKWGTDDFNAQPLADGMVLLLSLIPGTTPGPDDDTLPLNDEKPFVGRDLAGMRPSSRHTLIVPNPAGGTTTITFTGLHRSGFGLSVTNPINFAGGVGSLQIPQLPGAVGVALTPDTPGVKLLPLLP
jgi:hypothetical protein